MKAIAIDGPSGAGKSTIARKVAERLGYIYVDTGALYRAIGKYVLDCGVGTKEEEKITKLLPQLKVELAFVDGEQRVLVNGTDVSDEIRLPAVSLAASDVSALQPVRRFLFSLQREIAATHNVIMDGRDIGTVILPHADVKIFLTASVEERAQRRYEQLSGQGIEASYPEILADMQKWDYNDSHRAQAPLKKAEDAILIDTTGNTLERSIQVLSEVILANLADE